VTNISGCYGNADDSRRCANYHIGVIEARTARSKLTCDF